MFLRLLAVGVLSLWVGAKGAIAARLPIEIEGAQDSRALISQVDENAPITITGELNSDSAVLEADGSYYAVHSFEGEAGENIAISLSSEDFDAYLILQDPRNNTIAQDDDSGGGTNALLIVTLPLRGTYRVVANTYAKGETGRYQLQWKQATATEQAIVEVNQLEQQFSQRYEAGQYAEAIPIAERILALHQTISGKTHLDVARSFNNLALLYQFQSRYREAESFYQEALEIYRLLRGSIHPDVATTLNNLADLSRVQGRYAEAESFYREALEILRADSENSQTVVATNLNNLAILYQSQGRYAEAEALQQEALAILRTELGNAHPDVATNLNNLAVLYQSQGRYTEAEVLQQEALAILRTELGNNHPDTATSVHNLATIYQIQGRHTEAERLYQEALEILRKTLGEAHPSVAFSLNGLALTYQRQGRYGEAEQLYREALEVSQTTLGETHPNTAGTLDNLAEFYQRQGRYGEAEQLYREALESFRTALGESHPNVAASLINLAVLHKYQGQSLQAINTLLQGLDIEEANLDLNLLTSAETQRQAYAASMRNTTDFTISLHLQHNLENVDAAHLALTTLLRRKGRILDTAINTLQTLRQQLTPRDQTLLDDLATVRSQLSALLYRTSDLPTDTYRAEFARLKAEENSLEAILARRSAVFRVETEPITIAAVQAQIPENAVLVELVRYMPYDFNNPQDPWGTSHYAAYLLGATGAPQAVDLGKADAIDLATADFSRALHNPTFPPDEAAQALYDLIFAPLQAHLGSAQHLLLSPDGQLNQIPFEALMDSQRRYLIESYQISYLTSGRDLLKLQFDVPHQQPPVLIAAPNYDQASVTTVIADSRRTNRRSSDLSQLRFGDLPGTAAEAAAIAPLLDVTPLTGDRATENRLKQVNSPQILHIATHGFFLEDLPELAPTDFGAALGLDLRASINVVSNQNREVRFTGPVENPLLRSGLALAGANRRESGSEDGILTALEAASLDLYGTQLVVLSACETGLGDVANGEGVYGLRRSLGIAGAESQMISLWQVSDRATEGLMVDYYKALLAGAGRSEALRQVQLNMLQRGRYSH
ncbi:tetratricopeptide repeat protein, partial [Almyronema epifaneia]